MIKRFFITTVSVITGNHLYTIYKEDLKAKEERLKKKEVERMWRDYTTPCRKI